MRSKWKKTKLKEMEISLIDCVHKTPPSEKDGIPYVAIPQLKDGQIDFTLDPRLISYENFIEWTKKAKPKHNDIVLSRRCNPGETAFVPEGIDFALGQNLVLLRSNGICAYPNFLRWLVRGPEWWEQIDKYINVGAIFNSLKCADIPNFELTFPPFPEQIAIANILDSIDNKIASNNRINKTLETIAQTLFKSWFIDFEPMKAKLKANEQGEDPKSAAMMAISGKTEVELGKLSSEKYNELESTVDLFPNELDETESGALPYGWKIVSLYETAEYINGAAFSNEDFSLEKEGLPIIKIAELKSGISLQTQYTTNNISEKYRIDNGDMLYSWSGSPETSLEVFKWFGGQGWLNQHIFKINTDTKEQKVFVYFLLQYLKPQLIEIAKNKQTTGLGHVTVADMKRIKVVIPDDKGMQLIKNKLVPLFDKSSNCLQQNMVLVEQRDTLLPRLLSGELSITEKSES